LALYSAYSGINLTVRLLHRYWGLEYNDEAKALKFLYLYMYYNNH